MIIGAAVACGWLGACVSEIILKYESWAKFDILIHARLGRKRSGPIDLKGFSDVH